MTRASVIFGVMALLISTLLVVACHPRIDAGNGRHAATSAPQTQKTISATSPTPAALRKWAQETAIALDMLAHKAEQLHQLEEGLYATGYPPDREKDAVFQWSHRASPHARSLLQSVHDLHSEIQEDIVQLWFDTGYPGIIPEYAYWELSCNVSAVVSDYHEFLRTQGGTAQSEIVRASIPMNIDALGTRYCWVAFQTLQKWIGFYRNFVIDHGNYQHLYVDPARRAGISQAMRTWYEHNQMRLRWHKRTQSFRKDGVTKFVLPSLDFGKGLGELQVGMFEEHVTLFCCRYRMTDRLLIHEEQKRCQYIALGSGLW